MKLLPIAAAAALLLPGVAGAGLDPGPRCPASPGRGPAGLPAPVLLATGRCGAFVVRPDGRVVQVAPRRGPLGNSQLWLRKRHRHVVLVDAARRVLWRSVGRWPKPVLTEAVAGDRLAFTISRRLYVARLGAAERFVARGEEPVVWTAAAELITARWRGNRATIAVRDEDGRLLRVLARGRFQAVDWERNELYILRRGVTWWTDGRAMRPLARLRALGLAPRTAWVEPLSGGLVAFQGPPRHDGLTRLVVVRRGGGGVFAAVTFKGPFGFTLAASPDGRAVAVTGWKSEDYRTGVDSYWLLGEGDRRPRLVARRSIHVLSSCGRDTRLLWRGRFLLTTNTEGTILSVDSASGAVVDLTGLARRLSGGSRRPWVAWAEWTS